MPAAQAPTNFATATVGELAEALDELAQTAQPATATGRRRWSTGAAPWVRPWSLDLDERPRRRRPRPRSSGAVAGVRRREHPLAEPLRHALRDAPASARGVLVCLPEDCAEEQLALALHGAQARRSAAPPAPGSCWCSTAAARPAWPRRCAWRRRTLRTTIVHAPAGPEAVDRVVAEVAATTAFTEVHYDADGARRVPTLRALPVRPARTEPPLDASDVLLVTGGGKGITAECALAMAADSGAKLAAARPVRPGAGRRARRPTWRASPRRACAVRYARADVTDAGRRCGAAVAELDGRARPGHRASCTAPAATSRPRLPASTRHAFRQHLRPEDRRPARGARRGRPGPAQLLVTLGSIIGRAGLRGEAHYATANEWLADLTAEVGAASTRTAAALCLEWSVWSGVGMGERLSVVESLTRDGHHPDHARTRASRSCAGCWPTRTRRRSWSITGRTEGIDTRPLRPAGAAAAALPRTGRWCATTASSWSPRSS